MMRQSGTAVQALRPLRGRADARAWTPTPPRRGQPPPRRSRNRWATSEWTSRVATDKQGSTLLRWAAVEAAQRIPASAGWLAGPRAQITARRGRNIATVAVARRLLTLVYYGLRDGHIRALQPRPADTTAGAA